MCAYNTVCGGGDTTTTARPRVRAGDTILVYAGLYKYRPEYYGPDHTYNMTSPYEGTYYLTASGTPDRPIVTGITLADTKVRIELTPAELSAPL
jgi:hypothetical protein